MGSKTVVKSTPPPTPKQYMPKAPPMITRKAIEADREKDADANRLINQRQKAGLKFDGSPKFEDETGRTLKETAKEKAKKIAEAKKFKPKKVNKVGYGSIMADSTIFNKNQSKLGY